MSISNDISAKSRTSIYTCMKSTSCKPRISNLREIQNKKLLANMKMKNKILFYT
jgi:hypothetical protein